MVPQSSASSSDASQRLQKVLAGSGLGSRRKCEELILAGRVEVDGQVVTELGTRVDPDDQEIRVDGEVLKASRRLYFVVNKPPGVLSTNRDPSGRPRVIDLIPGDQRLFTVGRLDRSSEGLILVTNDGDLANRLAHPRYGVAKTYIVQVAGQPERGSLQKLLEGVHLAEGVVRAISLRIKRRRERVTDLEIVLSEGRNREIRRMLARVGHKVLRLKRVSIGPLRLGDLPLGASRPLTAQELRQLQQAARHGGKVPAASAPRRRKAKPARSGQASSAQRGAESAGRQPRRSHSEGPAGRKPGKRKPTSGRPGRPGEARHAEQAGTRKPTADKRAAKNANKKKTKEGFGGAVRRGGTILGADEDFEPQTGKPRRPRKPRSR